MVATSLERACLLFRDFRQNFLADFLRRKIWGIFAGGFLLGGLVRWRLRHGAEWMLTLIVGANPNLRIVATSRRERGTDGFEGGAPMGYRGVEFRFIS
jgi:hypothetical protein